MICRWMVWMVKIRAITTILTESSDLSFYHSSLPSFIHSFIHSVLYTPLSLSLASLACKVYAFLCNAFTWRTAIVIVVHFWDTKALPALACWQVSAWHSRRERETEKKDKWKKERERGKRRDREWERRGKRERGGDKEAHKEKERKDERGRWKMRRGEGERGKKEECKGRRWRGNCGVRDGKMGTIEARDCYCWSRLILTCASWRKLLRCFITQT